MSNPRTELFETFAIQGMSLRDYFAAQALQAIIIREGKNALRVDDLTFTAYQYADGMIKEREAK